MSQVRNLVGKMKRVLSSSSQEKYLPVMKETRRERVMRLVGDRSMEGELYPSIMEPTQGMIMKQRRALRIRL